MYSTIDSIFYYYSLYIQMKNSRLTKVEENSGFLWEKL